MEWLLLTSLAEQGGRTGGGVLVVPGVWCWEGASLGGVGVRELVGLLLFSHLGFGQAHTGFSELPWCWGANHCIQMSIWKAKGVNKSNCYS